MGCGSCGTGGCGSGAGSIGGCSSGACGTDACPSMHVFDWLNDLSIGQPTVTYDLVEVTFKAGRKGIYRNTQNLPLQTGDFVLVGADRGRKGRPQGDAGEQAAKEGRHRDRGPVDPRDAHSGDTSSITTS